MKAVRLLGVPLDLGAGRRGVDMGPSALRIAGIAQELKELGFDVEDGGNVFVPQREEEASGDPTLRFLGPIAQVCRALYDRTLQACLEGRMPVVLGGDHSLAMGSVPAVAEAARREGGRVGVVWLDAHGDMNTPASSPSGNVHGMPLACILGSGHPALTGIGGPEPGVDPRDVALLGVRAIDRQEAEAIRATGVRTWTMRDVDQHGFAAVLQEAIAALAHCDRLHVSFDVDFLDPGIAPGVGTRVRGGPNYREAHLVMELLAETGKVRSVDIVELNPILDTENATGRLAVELVGSLFGRSIL